MEDYAPSRNALLLSIRSHHKMPVMKCDTQRVLFINFLGEPDKIMQWSDEKKAIVEVSVDDLENPSCLIKSHRALTGFIRK